MYGCMRGSEEKEHACGWLGGWRKEPQPKERRHLLEDRKGKEAENLLGKPPRAPGRNTVLPTPRH